MPFDPKRTHAQIIGPGRARYFQDGVEYDAEFRPISTFQVEEASDGHMSVTVEKRKPGRPRKDANE